MTRTLMTTIAMMALCSCAGLSPSARTTPEQLAATQSWASFTVPEAPSVHVALPGTPSASRFLGQVAYGITDGHNTTMSVGVSPGQSAFIVSACTPTTNGDEVSWRQIDGHAVCFVMHQHMFSTPNVPMTESAYVGIDGNLVHLAFSDLPAHWNRDLAARDAFFGSLHIAQR